MLDFSKGGGYIYQWRLALFLDYIVRGELSINQGDISNNDYKKCFENAQMIKKLINENEIDLILEGNDTCFEDINYLSRKGSIILCYFIQSKGQEIQNHSAFRAKLLDIIMKFENNINQIDTEYKLIVVHNHELASQYLIFNRPSKNRDDNDRLTKLIISLLRKTIYPINKVMKLLTKRNNNKSLLYIVIFNIITKQPTAQLISKYNISDDIILKIHYYIELFGRIFILHNIGEENIKSIMTNYLKNTKSTLLYNDLYIKYQDCSIDRTPINKLDSKYRQYLKYENLYFSFKEKKGYKALELEEISEGKFLDL